MQAAVTQQAEQIAQRTGRPLRSADEDLDFASLSSLYQHMFDATEHIRLNHYHSDEVVKALQLLTRSVASKEEAPYLLVHMRGTQTMELLLRCLSNIDEEVLYHACLALYALIQRSPPARLLFLRKQGIAELAECLRDYNTDVKATSLRILCLLAAESEHARDEMRTEEVLLGILRTVQAYPAEDVTLPVLDAALEAVAHIVLSSRTNQDYIRSVSGLAALVTALQHCLDALPEHTPSPSAFEPPSAPGGAAVNSRRGLRSAGTRVEAAATCGAPSAVTAASRPGTAGRTRPQTAGRVRAGSGADPMGGHHGEGARGHRAPALDVWKVTETACDALNNVAYRNADNQAALLELGVLPACLTLLSRHDPSRSGADSVAAGLHAGALYLLINMADTNRDSQDALGDESYAAAVHRLLCASSSPRIVCAVCLLLSHVAWNHPANQQLYATEPAIQQLLALLSPAGRDRFALSADPAEAAGQASELALYAMMALVNLSYCNPAVQELVRSCGGVPLLQQQTGSPLYEARKTAAFCLGNLVRDNAANARELVSHGGVEALLRCVNDEDDDELSKTAYSTILHLGQEGGQQLLSLIQTSATSLVASRPARGGGRWAGGAVADGGDSDVDDDGLEEMRLDDRQTSRRPASARRRPASAAVSGGGTLFAARDGGKGGACTCAPASEATGEASAAEAVSLLDKALAVLNGMAYTAESHVRTVLAPTGLAALLPLLCDRVPIELVEQAVHVIYNASSLKDPRALAGACAEGAVEALQAAAAAAHACERIECLCLAYGALTNFAEGFPQAGEYFARDADSRALLLSLCNRSRGGSMSASDQVEVLSAAATLLLALWPVDEARRMLGAGGRQALEAIASSGASSETLAAHAKQALRETM